MANRDFRFQPDAIVFEKIPGLEVMPVEKIGRYPDQWVRE